MLQEAATYAHPQAVLLAACLLNADGAVDKHRMLLCCDTVHKQTHRRAWYIKRAHPPQVGPPGAALSPVGPFAAASWGDDWWWRRPS